MSVREGGIVIVTNSERVSLILAQGEVDLKFVYHKYHRILLYFNQVKKCLGTGTGGMGNNIPYPTCQKKYR